MNLIKSCFNDLPLQVTLRNKLKVTGPGLRSFHQVQIAFSHVNQVTEVESWAVRESRCVPGGTHCLGQTTETRDPPFPHLSDGGNNCALCCMGRG